MNQFKENYHGIVNHDGEIMVAKSKIRAIIKNIQKSGILVQTSKTAFVCEVHKELKDFIRFMEVGDTAFIKFNCGKPYIVGFRKKEAVETTIENTGDFAVNKCNLEWW